MKISYQYDPDDAVVQRIGRHVHGQWRALTEMVVIFIMLAILYVISQMIMRMWSDYFAALSPSLPVVVVGILWAGITLGLVGSYLVIFFISKYRDLVSDREAETSDYRAGPVRVELSEEGIATHAPARTQRIGWSAVQHVVNTPLGLGLRLDDKDYIPVTVENLPQGVSKDQLAEAIRGWRGGA